MTSELEAILGSDLVTMVFLFGSAVMLIASMIAVTWLTGRRSDTSGHAVRHPVLYKVAQRH